MTASTVTTHLVDQWDTIFQDLKKYKLEHGNCLVPHTYPANPRLARWVKRQRYQYKLLKLGKSASMPIDRIKMLEDLGFVWDSHQLVWEKMFRELMEYKERHGDCDIPSKYPANSVLATWATRQRSQYKLYITGKKSSITPERVAVLEDVGFTWTATSRKRKSLKRKAPKQDPEPMKALPVVPSDFSNVLNVLCDMSDDGEDHDCSKRIEISKEDDAMKPDLCISNPADLLIDALHDIPDADVDEIDLGKDFSVNSFLSEIGIDDGLKGETEKIENAPEPVVNQSEFLKTIIDDFSDDEELGQDLFDFNDL